MEANKGKAQVVFIDKFFVPDEARETFYQRVRENRVFIRTLPGFLGDEAFESREEHGGWVFMTIAKWADSAALGRAKERVQEENKRRGFDPLAFMQSLGVRMERGVFKPVKEVG
jgi:hypothetical protein